MNQLTADALELADLVAALNMSCLDASAGPGLPPADVIRRAVVAAIVRHGVEAVRDTAARQALSRGYDERLTWCRMAVSRLVAAEARARRRPDTGSPGTGRPSVP
jgi:hypothetical protein